MPLRRAGITWIALFVLAGLMLYQARMFLRDPSFLIPQDYVEYYAAGKLNFQGQNPYDPDLLYPIEVAAGGLTPDAVMMWNPPWTLPFVMPFAFLPPRLGQFVFLALSLAFILISVDGLWREYGGPRESRWMAWLGALLFLPTVFVIQMGQISAFLLLGAYLFLHCHRRQRYFLAGMITILMAIKPHLFAFVWLAILWEGRWRVWLGGIVAGLIAMAIAMSTNPDVWSQYREAITQRPPAMWITPTFGTGLRMLFGVEYFNLQFVPLIPGLLWFLFRYRWPGQVWDWGREMPILVLASFLTSPYGAWWFDMIILALPITYLAVVTRRKRAFLALFVAINVVFLIVNLFHLSQFYLIIVTLGWCVAYPMLQPSKDATS